MDAVNGSNGSLWVRGWLPVVFTLLVQTAGIVWWASSLSYRVAAQERELERQHVNMAALMTTVVNNQERLTKVQTILESFDRSDERYLEKSRIPNGVRQ